jgi:hypothetical protein
MASSEARPAQTGASVLKGGADQGLGGRVRPAGEAPASSSATRPVTVHPVVADANRAWLIAQATPGLLAMSGAAVRLLQAFTSQLDCDRPADWPAWLEATPHLAALLDWLAGRLDAEALAGILSVTDPAISALRWSGAIAAAEELSRSGVTAAGPLGPDHPAGLTARHRLAQVLSDQGQDTEAERLYRQLLVDQRRVLGEDHPATSTPSVMITPRQWQHATH